MTSLTPTRIAMLGATHAHAARKARWLRGLPQIEFGGAYEPSSPARPATGSRSSPECRGSSRSMPSLATRPLPAW